ncbi:MAG: choice-of-anchor J domain-containing protein [Muribaculaceae bacterium]|nr:choice-of-anchor J domain-containing protein [Muribaculaceae bacterium]
MNKKLTSILSIGVLAGSAMGTILNADELAATFRSGSNQNPSGLEKGKINRNPSSRFNRAPGQAFSAPKPVRNAQSSRLLAPARIAAAANLADFPLLYGLNFRDNTWQTLTSLPSKVFSFQRADGTELVAESGETVIESPMAACYGNGKFYALYSNQETDSDYNTLITTRVEVYDATTWEKLTTLNIVENTTDWLYYFRQVAAIDPISGNLYSATWGGGKPLVKINTETGEFTEIGATDRFLQALFFDNEGNLYGIDFSDKNLYSINKETGEATAIGELNVPFSISANPQSLVYDPATGKALWIAVDSGSLQSYICEVSLSDAQVEILGSMPGNEHILGLYMPEAAAAAPAAPTAIEYAAGIVRMTLPSTTYITDENLSGDITILLTVDNGETITATGTPGATAEIPMALADGKHHIKIRLENQAGLSPVRRLDTFIGNDIPMAVENLNLMLEGKDKLILTWDAPQKSVNGGAIDDSELNYRIVRLPDETVVADNYKETSFSEAVPEAHAGYTYRVDAFAADRQGESAVSNRVTAGEFWITPFIETFDTQDDFDSFKIIDANNDLQTWAFILPAGETSGYAVMWGNGTADVDTGIYEGNGNDDYLISPFARLKAGQDYRMRFDIGDNFMWYEHMTILLGKSRELTGSETPIFAEELEAHTSYSFLFSVPEDGDYAFFFHGDNPGQSVDIVMDNVALDDYAVYKAPSHVENVKATAGDLGVLTNTLEFTAPTATYKGDALSGITEIRIFRNDGRHAVKVFENPTPGETLTWTDNDVENGNVTYRILPYNAEGQGEEYLITNWVGLDEPSNVTGLHLKMNENNKAVATFNASEGRGMHGGYVDNDAVTYALFRYNPYNWFSPWEQATPFSDSLTITDEDYELWWGQQYVDYIVVAANEAGYSSGTPGGIVLGTPYDLPYNESFAYGFASQDPWTLFASTYYYAWKMVNGDGLPVKPYDNDGGMLQFSLLDEDSNNQVLSGPRINIANTTDNELSFYMWHGFEAEEEDLQLIVYVNYNDEGWNEVARLDYNNGIAGWMRHSVALSDEATDVQIAFGAYAADASASVYVDAIKIAQGSPCDMALLSTAISSKRVNPGEEVKISVTVGNYGTTTAEDVTVNLLADENVVESRQIASLTPSATENVEFVIPVTREMASTSFSYTAAVEIENDANLDNNTGSPVMFFVKGSVLPTPENLNASVDESVVNLDWSAPAKSEMTEAVTDDFEAYDPFIIDNIGDWTTYDGDGTQTVYFGGPEVPNAYEPKAWQVWAPEAAGFSLEKFDVLTPKSGAQYLTCWAASNGIDSTLPNDDWLISSEITGGSEVSFWYRMPNTGSDPQKFEMLYSTTSNEPEDFVVFDSDAITFGTDWVYFEYTLPRDARYFAIRSCSTGSYTVALLDDITYTPLYGATNPLTLQGYNVYRDNELIAEAVEGTAYTDEAVPAGNHTYHVTALWAEGESDYSAPAMIGMTGIFAPNAGEATVRVTKGMITVNNAHGLETRIFTPAGLTVAASTDANATFQVAPGVYMVQVGQKVTKVNVR